MDLMALSDFNAVALHGGFGAAGRALDRPKATLSRRVAELEASLGVRLIERGVRRLRLTEDGVALHERTRGLLSELQEAGEAVASRAPVAQGRLRISAPVVFAHVVLGAVAARFALAYPQVELEVIAEDRIVDPVDDGYDLVIRINPPADALLVGRRIMRDTRVLVSAPTISIPADAMPVRPPLSDNETATFAPAAPAAPTAPTAPAAPAAPAAPTVPGVPAAPTVPAVIFATSASDVPFWRVRDSHGEERSLTPNPVLRFSSLLMVRDAVAAGVGVGMLPGLLVEQDVRNGRLRQWGAEAANPVEIWALYSSRRLLSAKVRAFLDMLHTLDKSA